MTSRAGGWALPTPPGAAHRPRGAQLGEHMSRLSAAVFVAAVFVLLVWTVLAPLPPLWPL